LVLTEYIKNALSANADREVPVALTADVEQAFDVDVCGPIIE
jgi:hypothetical protein